MSIVRYPTMSLYGVQRDLQREMNRIFDSVFPTPRKATEEGFESAVWRPVVDVHEAYRRLIDLGVQFSRAPRRDRVAPGLDLITATLLDPDGHAIQLVQEES